MSWSKQSSSKLKSKTIAGMKQKGNDSSANTKLSPPIKNNSKDKFIKSIGSLSQSTNTTNELSCESIIQQHLINLMSIWIKRNENNDKHKTDYETIKSSQILEVANTKVEEELERWVEKLSKLRGDYDNPNHRITAYSQVLNELVRSVEFTFNLANHDKLNQLISENKSIKEESNQFNLQLTDQLAKKDQQIIILERKINDLEAANRSLTDSSHIIQKELANVTLGMSIIQQKAVDIRLQSLHFKGEVDYRSKKIVKSIHSRLGFVPLSIQKQVMQLQLLKPPGDIEYSHPQTKELKSFYLNDHNHKKANKKKFKKNIPLIIPTKHSISSFMNDNNRTKGDKELVGMIINENNHKIISNNNNNNNNNKSNNRMNRFDKYKTHYSIDNNDEENRNDVGLTDINKENNNYINNNYNDNNNNNNNNSDIIYIYEYKNKSSFNEQYDSNKLLLKDASLIPTVPLTHNHSNKSKHEYNNDNANNNSIIGTDNKMSMFDEYLVSLGIDPSSRPHLRASDTGSEYETDDNDNEENNNNINANNNNNNYDNLNKTDDMDSLASVDKFIESITNPNSTGLPSRSSTNNALNTNNYNHARGRYHKHNNDYYSSDSDDNNDV
eukprot:gene11980-16036_t